MTATRFVCPFCPLHCDDLEPSAGVGASSDCPILSDLGPRSFAHDRDTPPPQSSQLEQARQWVRAARTIAVTGRVIDLETARAVSRFASRTGAGLLPLVAPDDLYPEAFARDGGIGTTLGEASSPHQTVIVIGDPDPHWPRLRQRLTGAGKTYFWQGSDQIVARLARLRGELAHPKGQSTAASDGLDDADVATTHELIRDSKAVVFLIVPAAVAAEEQRLLWSTAGGLIADLNRRIRAMLLRFDASLTLRSVVAWTREAPSAGLIEPDAIGGNEPLAPNGDVDLVIDMTPWGDRGTLPNGTVPRRDSGRSAAGAGPRGKRRITIGQNACGGGEGSPDVSASETSRALHLPASTPGITARSMAIRGDGSVALPLGMWAETGLPTAAEWLAKLGM